MAATVELLLPCSCNLTTLLPTTLLQHYHATAMQVAIQRGNATPTPDLAPSSRRLRLDQLWNQASLADDDEAGSSGDAHAAANGASSSGRRWIAPYDLVSAALPASAAALQAVITLQRPAPPAAAEAALEGPTVARFRQVNHNAHLSWLV